MKSMQEQARERAERRVQMSRKNGNEEIRARHEEEIRVGKDVGKLIKKKWRE